MCTYTAFSFFFLRVTPGSWRTHTFVTKSPKSPKFAAGRANINNGMIMNQIVREKPISYWSAGANDWPRGIPARLSIPRCRSKHWPRFSAVFLCAHTRVNHPYSTRAGLPPHPQSGVSRSSLRGRIRSRSFFLPHRSHSPFRAGNTSAIGQHT